MFQSPSLINFLFATFFFEKWKDLLKKSCQRKLLNNFEKKKKAIKLTFLYFDRLNVQVSLREVRIYQWDNQRQRNSLFHWRANESRSEIA